MRGGDLTSGPAQLQKCWKKLRDHWEYTKPFWRDSVSRDFEENYLDKLEPQIVATLERMRSLTGVLTSAEQTCER